MPIGLAIAGAAIVGAVATSSAASSAANASQKATDATIQNNQDNIAATAKNQADAIQATRDNTAKALDTVNREQNQSYGNIQDLQADTKNVAGQTRNANLGVWQQFRDSLTPYTQAGTQAVNNLANPNASFAVSPDYNFRLGQGEDAVATNKSVNGLLRSGSALKAVNNYAQNTASSEFANWWARQQGLVSTGLTATGDDETAAGQVAGVNNAYRTAVGDINNTLSNEENTKATTVGNAAEGQATALNTVASQSATANDNAGNLATASTNNALGTNAVNQGNAGLVTSNAVGSSVGSIADLLAKYSTNSNGSSYTAANENGAQGPGMYASNGAFLG